MRVFLIFLITLFLYASNLDNLLKDINKSTPDYSYAKILVLKINSLKPKKFECNCEVNNQNSYIKSFLQIVNYRKKIDDIDNQINDIDSKLSILQNSPLSNLQKIYYQKEKDILKKEKDFLISHISIWTKNLYEKLNMIDFDINRVKKNILILKKRLITNQKEFEKLNIDLQKWTLLGNSKEISKIKDLINKNLEYKRDIYKQLLFNHLIIWFYELKNKDKKVFNNSEILNIAKNLNIEKYLNKEMSEFEKLRFGNKYFIYNSTNEVKNIFDEAINILNYPMFKINKKEITPFDLIVLLLILIVGYLLGKYYKKLIYSLRDKYDINYSTATLLANMGYYFIITLAFLIALKSIGLDLSSLAIVAGALSVGIGFGLQNIVSNFVSGIIMMFEKSIKIGDYIQIDSETRGEVVDISMRSTVIKTNDNINLIIPNQTFIQNQIINWTMNDDIVRMRIPFGVAYGSDIEKLERIILDELQKSKLPFIRSKNEHLQPRVVFIEMGNSSLNFELFIWVKGKFARMPRRTKSQFLKFLYKVLNSHGFEIPFPQNDIHFRNPLEVKLKDEREL